MKGKMKNLKNHNILPILKKFQFLVAFLKLKILSYCCKIFFGRIVHIFMKQFKEMYFLLILIENLRFIDFKSLQMLGNQSFEISLS